MFFLEKKRIIYKNGSNLKKKILIYPQLFDRLKY